MLQIRASLRKIREVQASMADSASLPEAILRAAGQLLLIRLLNSEAVRQYIRHRNKHSKLLGKANQPLSPPPSHDSIALVIDDLHLYTYILSLR